MHRSQKNLFLVVAALGCMFVLGGCCKSNESKTKACAHTTTSEDCQSCCGGNYSFVDSKANSCTCY